MANKPIKFARVAREARKVRCTWLAAYANFKAHRTAHGAVFLAMFWLCGSATAAPTCNAVAEHSAGYRRAAEVVRNLLEVQAWAHSHKFPVAYGEPVDKQVLVDGQCYWSVTVYANRPERLELWNVFYVSVTDLHVLIEDPVDGESIPLDTWRKKNAEPRAPSQVH